MIAFVTFLCRYTNEIDFHLKDAFFVERLTSAILTIWIDLSATSAADANHWIFPLLKFKPNSFYVFFK